MTTMQPPEPDETGSETASKAPDGGAQAADSLDVRAPDAGSPADSPDLGDPADAAAAAAETPHLHLHSLGRDLMTGLGFFTRLPVPATSGSLAEAAHVFAPIG